MIGINQPPPLTAAALPVILVPPAPAATSGEHWRYLPMGFNICFNWREKSADAEARNEELTRSLLAKFPSLSRLPLDFDAIAESIGVPREEVLSHWCQIELDDAADQLGSAIITFWLESIVVQVPSRPALGIPATLERLAPLFRALRDVGLETDAEFDVLAEYEIQKGRVDRVARIVGEGG